LHFAAQEQRAEVTETLLRAGAEVDARDAYGNTPLWRAVFTSRGQVQVVGHLLAAGADPDLANTAGVSPRQLRSALQTTTLRSSFRRAPDDCLVPLTVRIWPMSG
jgi:ankyrin repeat protein